MSATRYVLEAVRGRSLHFPKLVRAGRIKRVEFFLNFLNFFQLVFGSDGVQEVENDPECNRAVLIIQNPLPYALVSSIQSFSPTG